MSISNYEIKEFQDNHPKQYAIHTLILFALIIGICYLGFVKWDSLTLMKFGAFVVFFKIISDKYMKWTNKKDEEAIDNEIWFS